MKRGVVVCLVLFLIVCGAIILIKRLVLNSDHKTGEQQPVDQVEKSRQTVRSVPPEPSPNQQIEVNLPGDEILSGYGKKTQTPQRDIEQVKELVANSMLLVKNRDPREYATNEDLAEFLTGKNKFNQAMLSKQHSIINKQGQLVDRWGNPLIVHVISSREVEIFGSGPDGIAWNSDDIGRLPR